MEASQLETREEAMVVGAAALADSSSRLVSALIVDHTDAGKCARCFAKETERPGSIHSPLFVPHLCSRSV